ncbi:low affinity immunoglobulin epsilon Fc receptor-like [Ahaetulla prasina]|uniref:low affinity immunoglobulin epsilon Fc receptor-like n=1 Tax=Ahaetulla prasina TaxID=499056 RepID=UPI00264717DC|nr:low affinity immunoglobulin epsilon Fc receptor-like [Ahaetulla prasina]
MGRFIFVSLSLLVVALSLSGVKGCCCPNDWLSRNGFCYKVNDQFKTWNDAEMLCRKFKPGCHLASIHSMAESADLAEYITDYLNGDGNVWIGLNDPQKKHNWVWSDRSCTDYYSWNSGEPNNQQNKENCVELIAKTANSTLRRSEDLAEFEEVQRRQPVPPEDSRDDSANNPGPDGSEEELGGTNSPSDQLDSLPGNELGREGRKTMGRFSFLSLGLLVVVLSLSGVKGCCPHEWFSRSSFCYKVFEEAKTWEEAEEYCRKYKHGCHLASLDDKEELEDMAVHISQKFKVNIWIGLSRPSHKEQWKWSDGSKVSYTSWKSGNPNNKQTNENCVELWAESGYKKWNNEKCASLRPFFCQCIV